MNNQFKHLLKNPTGLSMDMMAERLSHLLPIIDFLEIDTIFDVGAAHGYESLNLARVFSHANIYGFEPTPEHYEYCLKHYAGLSPWLKDRIHIENIALNDKNGPLTFYPLADNAQSNNTGMASKFKLIDPLVFPHELNLQKEITVNARTLDSWCTEHKITPDLIWMDVQGSESAVLSGGHSILGTVKVILTEAGTTAYYEGQGLKKDIDNILLNFGFVELVSAQKIMHQYEIDTIYIKNSI